jgi:hypothetical protein
MHSAGSLPLQQPKVRAKEAAMRAPVTAATPTRKATDAAMRTAVTAARRVVVAACHVDTTTHYQTADGGIQPYVYLCNLQSDRKLLN